MTLSELIAAYGNDKVAVQKLDDCASTLNMTKQGSRITFVTPEKLDMSGTVKLGLIVWMDRQRVTEILAAPPRRDEAEDSK